MSFHRVANKKRNKQHRQRQIWSDLYEMFGRVSRGCASWSVIWDVYAISNTQETGALTYSRVLFVQLPYGIPMNEATFYERRKYLI